MTGIISPCPAFGASFPVGREEGGSPYRKVTCSRSVPAWRGRAGECNKFKREGARTEMIQPFCPPVFAGLGMMPPPAALTAIPITAGLVALGFGAVVLVAQLGYGPGALHITISVQFSYGAFTYCRPAISSGGALSRGTFGPISGSSDVQPAVGWGGGIDSRIRCQACMWGKACRQCQ